MAIENDEELGKVLIRVSIGCLMAVVGWLAYHLESGKVITWRRAFWGSMFPSHDLKLPL